MKIKGGSVRKHFFNAPEERVFSLRHLKGEATRLCLGQTDMIRQVRFDDLHLINGRAAKEAREPNLSFWFVHIVSPIPAFGRVRPSDIASTCGAMRSRTIIDDMAAEKPPLPISYR
jgi:hypothetical protein